MADWTTISALATAGGTLVLASATFASVRSANRAARVLRDRPVVHFAHSVEALISVPEIA